MMRLIRSLILFVTGLAAGRRLLSRRKRNRAALRRRDIPFWVYGWKGFFKRLLVILPLVAVGGFLLAASGVISLKASSGHFGITRWFLEFSMARSVSTYSMGISAPALDDPALVLKGAGHYETGCRPCHGAVSDVQPGVPRQMTPNPPAMPEAVPNWDAAELFYIVKHGVKFTGMPAFPSLERDDEVWSVVAFLQQMPAMSVPEYRRLVFGSEENPETGLQHDAPIAGLPHDVQSVIGTCRRCHGEGGRGQELSAYPRLAGQKANYLYAQLLAYASGERHSGMMEPIATGLTAEEMREIATFYENADVQPALGVRGASPQGATAGPAQDTLAQDALGVQDTLGAQVPAGEQVADPVQDHPDAPADPDRIIVPDASIQQPPDERTVDGVEASIARGQEIARGGIPRQKVPACRDCHGPNRVRRNPFYPELAGQYAEFLLLQLELFKSGRRGGSAYAQLMRPTAEKLTKEQMKDVALYYESLGGGPVAAIAPYVDRLVPTEH